MDISKSEKLTISDVLKDAKAPFGAPENLESIEICLDKAISSVTFYPWIRAMGKDVFEEISDKYEDFTKQTTGHPYLKVTKNCPPQFFTIELKTKTETDS